jgi:hypothetical protein
MLWPHKHFQLVVIFAVSPQVAFCLQPALAQKTRWSTFLLATPQAQHQMQGGLFLNVVVRQRSALLQLLTGKNQTLLIRWNTFFVLNFGFYHVDGVGRFHFQCDGFASQSLSQYGTVSAF